MSVLTEAQRKQYEALGFVQVSGLIPEDVVKAAEQAIWQGIGAEPNDPTTWPGHSYQPSPERNAAVSACYNAAILSAAAELAGESADTFHPPSRPYPINVFPSPGEWKWPGAHIDHAIKEHGHHTFPRAFRIASMLYLNDVPSHGAATVVWPGSHLKIEALARSDEAKYALMWSLNQDLTRVDLGEPIEVTAKQGDILFYHYLCAHAGSQNTSTRPRLAINMKW